MIAAGEEIAMIVEMIHDFEYTCTQCLNTCASPSLHMVHVSTHAEQCPSIRRAGIRIRMAKALKSRPYAVKAGLSRGDGEMRRARHFEIDDRDGHSVL